jgi:choline-sulfatase
MFLALALACSTDPAPPVAPPPIRSSLVLVTMDTTRRDRIGAYGYALAHTPNVDRFASEGIRFDRAYATVPLTIPAHSSILTGVYPTKHGVHSNGDSVLPEGFETLAERLHAQGYATAAAVSAFVTTRAWNFDQGFDAYLDDLKGKEKANRWRQERPANETVDDAIVWLNAQAKDRPTFLWVHLYDPHRPYEAPATWNEQLPERPYDAEVAFMDEQIGRLRSAVDARAVPTAWMILADHGEALKQHGEDDHGLFLFQPTTAIPFLVVPTSAPATHTSDTVASGVDVVPTALGLLGLPVPTDVDGIDLLVPRARDAVYLEAFSAQERFGYHPELAVVAGDLKLMDTPSARLFDVKADPAEEKNLAAGQPADVLRLQALSKGARAGSRTTNTGTVAPEALRQLEALGYVGQGAIDTEHFSEIDAKDRLDEIAALNAAQAALQSGDLKRAETALRDVIAKNPSLREARNTLARALELQERYDEAVALFRESVASDPADTGTRMSLANCLAEAGRTDESLQLLEGVLDQVPEDAQARTTMLRVLRAAERFEEAEARSRAWLAQGPTTTALQAERGIALVELGHPQDAEPLLSQSMKDDVPRLDVLGSLAGVKKMAGDEEGARHLLELEVARFPFNIKARWRLAGIHMDAARWDDAADEYRLLATDTGNPGARRAWAQAVFNSGDYVLARDVLAPLDPESSEDPEIVLLQVNILDKLGEPDLARLLFERGRALRAPAQPKGTP